MAGTSEGGKRAAATNKRKYGPDFYREIGAKGGKLGKTGGFAAGEEGRKRARIYGAVGGHISRRRPASETGKPPVVKIGVVAPGVLETLSQPDTTVHTKRRLFSFLNR